MRYGYQYFDVFYLLYWTLNAFSMVVFMFIVSKFVLNELVSYGRCEKYVEYEYVYTISYSLIQ